MVVCLIIVVVVAGLFLCFRNYKKEIFEALPKKGNELKLLYPVSCRIITFLRSHGINMSNAVRRRKLDSLNVLKDGCGEEIIYNIRRLALSIFVLFVAAVIGILYFLSESSNEYLTENGLMRPGYKDTARTYNIEANHEELELVIEPREYSWEEVTNNFVTVYEFLVEYIKGDNASLEQVSDKLNLITYIDTYAMKAEWMSSNTQLIDVYGNVENDEFEDGESENVTLTVTLSYLEYKCQYEIDVVVVAPVLDEREKFIRELKRAVSQNDRSNPSSETVMLPDVVLGTPVKYAEKKEDYTILLVILGVVAAAGVFVGMDKELDEKIKERNKQMMMDYSEIVSKLNILSGAGMSILKAWEKIVKDYEKKTEKGKADRRYAYEEMKKTYYEIQSGISEGSAYSNFGRRCNIHEYLKLGALLEQNVKKGSKGLSKMLETESIQAFEQRKNLARKLGEEAGTKMLIPMFIMLAVVMVIVMVPAFTSFNI